MAVDVIDCLSLLVCFGLQLILLGLKEVFNDGVDQFIHFLLQLSHVTVSKSKRQGDNVNSRRDPMSGAKKKNRGNRTGFGICVIVKFVVHDKGAALKKTTKKNMKLFIISTIFFIRAVSLTH